MTKIQFPNKVKNNGLTTNGKWRAEDANEVKEVVNYNADTLSLLRLELESLSGNLSSKVGRKEIQMVANQIVSMSTILEQTAEHILLKADKTQLDLLNGTLVEHSATLQIQASQISAQVTKNEYDQLKTLIASYKTLVEQTAEAITLKAERSTTDVLSGRIDTAMAEIQITADAITSLVSKETVDALTNRVGLAESSIVQQANQISSKVSQTDFNGSKMISEINQTAEQVRISASKIALEGTLTIGAFDPSTQSAIGGAIAAANANSVVALTAYINAIVAFAAGRGQSSKTKHIQYFGTVAPTTAAAGDIFYNKTTQAITVRVGTAWNAVTAAELASLKDVMLLASYAQDVGDSERRVFTAQPTVPYYRGDLWKQPSAIMRCNLLRIAGNFTSTDWIAADRYIDDAAAMAAEANAKSYADELKTQLQEEIQQLDDALDDLDGTINAAFKDGLISEMEKIALTKQIQLVDTEKSDIEQRAILLKDDPYIPAGNKVALTTALTVFLTAHTNLKGAINSAIADGKITPGEATDVDVKLEVYRQTLLTLSQEMQKATSAIAQKHVESLQIGGRNLLMGTRSPLRLTASGWASYNISQTMLPNQVYVLSGEVSMPASTNGKIYLAPAHSLFQAVLVELNKPFTFTGTTPTANLLIAINNAGTGIISASKMKLEKGTKATDWTEAPEDLDGRITTLNNDIKDLEERTSDLSGYIDNAFKDGVISIAEAQMIAGYLKTMDLEKLDVDNTYNIIVTNPYLPAAEKTQVVNAKTGHDTAYNTLVRTINEAIADSEITAIESAAVNAAFAAYKVALTTWATALSKANTAIIKAQNQEAIDDAAASLTRRIDEVNGRIGALPPGQTIIGVDNGVAYIKTDLINVNTLVVNRLHTQTGRLSINEEGLEQFRARYPNGALAMSIGVDAATNEPTIKMYGLDGRLGTEFNLGGAIKYEDPTPMWTELIRIPTGFNSATLTTTQMNTIRTRLSTVGQGLLCRNPNYIPGSSIRSDSAYPYGILGTARAWRLSFSWPRGASVPPDQQAILNATGFHSTKVVATTNWLADGWYIEGNTFWTTGVRDISGNPIVNAAYLYRYVGGQEVGYARVENITGSQTAPVCTFLTLESSYYR